MRTRQYFGTSLERKKLNTTFKTNNNKNVTKKVDILSYLNLLQKCTQILREDRLWIRNQLKSGNQELTSLFRNIKKPLNMQHLQIKLRKHISAVKQKSKVEQLMKFKENMSLLDSRYNDSKSEKFGSNFKKHNKSLNQKDHSYHIHERYKIPSTSSLDRTNKRTNKSLERIKRNDNQKKKSNRTSISYENFNYKDYHENYLKDHRDFDMPMQKITERQSENVTSARHRIFQEDFGQKNSFQKYPAWKRPNEEIQKSNFFNQILNHKDLNEEDEIVPKLRRENNYEVHQVRRDKEEPQSLSERKQNKNCIESQGIWRKKNSHLQNICDLPHSSFVSKNESRQPSSYREYHQSSEHPSSHKISQYKDKDKDENDSLFTSPQLLMECRMFINKSKNNSNEKRNNFEDLTTNLFQQNYQHSYYGKDLFSDQTSINNNFKMEYNFPSLNKTKMNSRDEFQKQDHHSPKPQIEAESSKNHQFFHTFASSNKKTLFELKKEQQQSIIFTNSPEEVIDEIIKESCSKTIPINNLLKIIRSKFPCYYSKIESQYKNSMNISIVELGRFIEKQYLKTMSYKRENEVYNVSSLLDIEKNGSIREIDIENFLDQLYEAEVDNIDHISELLWSLFDKGYQINHDNEKSLPYWGLYRLKNSKEFESLQQILGEFQFQMETQHHIF